MILIKKMIVTVPADESKTRISRTLPLLQPTVDAVNLLIKVRHSSWNDNAPVFCSNEGTMLNKDTWGDRLGFYSKQFNFKIRPYDLRHSFHYYILGVAKMFLDCRRNLDT